MIKTILKILALLIVMSAGAAIVYRDTLSNLYKVITLFDEEKIVTNFSNMRDILPSTDISVVRPSPGLMWPADEKPFATEFSWQGTATKIEEFLEDTQTTSLLVLHNGVLVHEQYRLGTERDDQRISWSMAKSFLSAMFGIAVADGDIKSLQDPVNLYVPSLENTAYDGVPIVDVLNMASGVQFDEDYLAFNSDINRMGRVLARGGSMDDFAHSLTSRARAAGVNRQYVSIDTHVLAMVLRTATGKSLPDYFSSRLWSFLEPTGDAYYLTDGEGVAFALGGLNMRTRDYARFGELFRNKGRWNGQQVIPEKWVQSSTANSAPAPASKTDPFGYGFQWWVPPDSNGEFFAVGIYGQYIYINPINKTVIVKTSAHRGFRDDGNAGKDIKHQTIEMFRAITTHYAGL